MRRFSAITLHTPTALHRIHGYCLKMLYLASLQVLLPCRSHLMHDCNCTCTELFQAPRGEYNIKGTYNLLHVVHAYVTRIILTFSCLTLHRLPESLRAEVRKAVQQHIVTVLTTPHGCDELSRMGLIPYTSAFAAMVRLGQIRPSAVPAVILRFLRREEVRATLRRHDLLSTNRLLKLRVWACALLILIHLSCYPLSPPLIPATVHGCHAADAERSAGDRAGHDPRGG